jgi:hypothetical protein
MQIFTSVHIFLHIYFAGIFMKDLYNIFSFEKIEKLFFYIMKILPNFQYHKIEKQEKKKKTPRCTMYKLNNVLQS